MWICVDGPEGTGKTTLADGLRARMPCVAVSEFSATAFGAALRSCVRENPHVITESAVGQSLMFLGDFIELYESRVAPAVARGETVLTDRGWVSKYAYQFVVLTRVMDGRRADRLLLEVLGHIPKPDLTILLSTPLPVIRSRLLDRDGSCDDTRLEFIACAARAAHEFVVRTDDLRVVEIDSDRPRELVLGEALDAVSP